MKKEEKIVAREQRELAKLERIKAKGRPNSYFWILFVIIILVNMLDEVSSSTGSTVTTNMIETFFVNNPFLGKYYTLEEGIALNSMLGAVTGVISILAPFYKVLGDKIGRKPLFVISTFGMAFGMVVVYFSQNYVVYLIGATFIAFFLGHDMQILYVLEEAPADKRTTLYSIAKSLGIFGTLAIPVLRNYLMGDDGSKWKNIYGIPGFFGLVLVVLVIIFARETMVFVHQRSEYLSVPRAERLERERLEKLKAKEDKKSSRKAGIIPAVKYIFSHQQLTVLMISQIVFCSAMIAMSSYYQPIMNDAGMSTADITEAIVAYPVVFGLLTLISGPISDKFGRKKTITSFAIVALISYVAFLLTAYSGKVRPIIVGICYGLYIGAYWIGKDYIEIMMTENTPTDIRASVMAAANFVYLGGTVVGYVVILVGIQFLPMWLPCLITVVPGLLVSIALLIAKVKETKGIDYEAITDDESEPAAVAEQTVSE